MQSQGIQPTKTRFGMRRWPFGQRLGARSKRATPEILAHVFDSRYGSGHRPVRREPGKHRPASPSTLDYDEDDGEDCLGWCYRGTASSLAPVGLNPGKKPRKLADMSAARAPLNYVRHSDAQLTMDGKIYLSQEDVLHQTEWTFRGRVVDFSLNHYVTGEHPDNWNDCPVDVARIDTCHSQVHKHQFYRSGREQNRLVIRDLSTLDNLDEARQAVEESYDQCYMQMADEWESHLERWKDAS